MIRLEGGRPSSGEATEATPALRVPGDKSISHRLLILCALADGESRIRGISTARDPASTAGAMRSLGAAIPPLGSREVVVAGGGLRSLRAPSRTLDCGNSATTARLLLGALAGSDLEATLDGDASLRSRPMRRVTEPLAHMGAAIEELGSPDRLPIRVKGGDLRPLVYDSPIASAQVKSALLLAGITGGVGIAVSEPTRSRDHTERLLGAMGVELALSESRGGLPFVALPSVSGLQPVDVYVPGDFSSAAYLLALAVMMDGRTLGLREVGLNPTRTGLLDALKSMGGSVEVVASRESAGEPIGDLVARGSELAGIALGGESVPGMIDELPLLAILGARARGETKVVGAGELRHKESDRIAAVVDNLRAVGARAEELSDGFVVEGGEEPLAGRVQARGDHRIAMAFGVLGALPGNRITIDHPELADISYPGFWNDLGRVAGGARDR